MVNEGRKFFSYLTLKRESAVAMLNLEESDYDLFDGGVTAGSSDQVFQLLCALRPEVMETQGKSPLFPKLQLRAYMDDYLTTRSANVHSDPTSPPNEIVTGIVVSNPLNPPSYREGGDGADPADQGYQVLEGQPMPARDLYQRIQRQGANDHNSSVDNSDRAQSGNLTDEDASPVMQVGVVGTGVVQGVPTVAGTAMDSFLPRGVPLEPQGPIKGSIDSATLALYRKLKADTSSDCCSSFLNFYRGVTTVSSPDNYTEQIDVSSLISLLPMVGDEEFPFLTTASAASVLFPIALQGDSIADGTFIHRPATDAELQYAKKDLVVRMRVVALVECFVAAMGLEAIKDYEGCFYVESQTCTNTQKRALNDPIQFRNCLRAIELLEAVGDLSTAKGIREYFSQKIRSGSDDGYIRNSHNFSPISDGEPATKTDQDGVQW